MSDFHAPITLTGRYVKLELLAPEHADGLRAAVSDGKLWELWFTSCPRPEAVDDYIAAALARQAAGEQSAWVVRDADGDIVGTTRFHAIDPATPRVNIGHTWYARRVQRTGLNTEAKLLLLGHAFETLRCIRVGFETSWFNPSSRAAIERLGARQDGVLRSHRRHADGSVRDTVVFSILEAEWPAVKQHLQARLARGGWAHG